MNYFSHALNYKYKNNSSYLTGRMINFDFFLSKSFYVALILAIVIFVAFYIIEVNKLSYFGYQIKDYKGNLAELQEKNRRLEIDVASKQSLSGLKEASGSLNMVDGGKFDYVVVREESLGFVQSDVKRH